MSVQLFTAPEPVRLYVPYAAPPSSRWKMAPAMSLVNVRRPYWSSTTVTSGNSPFATLSDKPIMVLTKLRPSPITQLERRM